MALEDSQIPHLNKIISVYRIKNDRRILIYPCYEFYSTPFRETYFLWTSTLILSLITLIPFVCITILLQLNRCNYALRGTKMHLCYYIFKYNHFVRPITQHKTSRYVHDNLWHVVYQHLKTRTEFDLFCNIALMRNMPIWKY